jgi:hypothetical protein
MFFIICSITSISTVIYDLKIRSDNKAPEPKNLSENQCGGVFAPQELIGQASANCCCM